MASSQEDLEGAVSELTIPVSPLSLGAGVGKAEQEL
jgi:hypothetical protein